MSKEKLQMIVDAIHAAMADGYYPIEDTLNGPKTKVIPAKVLCLWKCGCKYIHLNSDERGKECFQIAIA